MAQILITSLSQQDANVEQIAENFTHEFKDDRLQLLVELANIICSLCEIPLIPSRMIENDDIFAINAFLQKSLKTSAVRTHKTIEDLLSSKCWPNVPTFFHHLVYSEWDFLSGATKFDSFFCKFLKNLTDSDFPTLRFLSTAIQLEFTTVCSLEKIQLLRNEHKPAILNYTLDTIRSSFHDCERRIWHYSLSRMCLWFRHTALLLDHKLLRFLLWGLVDRSPTNSHYCLRISLELLDEHHEHKEALTSFIEKYVRALTPGLAFYNIKFFEELCDLAVILHNKYLDVSRAERFVDSLLEFTFAADRTKAKAAADVFVRTKLQNSSSFEQLRCIAQFLAPRNSVFVQLFVDAMIEDYSLFTNFEILADTLEKLPERETLLLVILCVVGSILDDETSPVRNEKPKISLDCRVTMTSALAPLLLASLRENVSFRWKSLVFKLASYFDLDHVSETDKGHVIMLYAHTCMESQSVVFDVAQTTLMFHLVICILQNDRNHDLERMIILVKEGYEEEFVRLERRLRHYKPDDFIALMNGVISLYCCRGLMPLDERCMFEIPMKLLQMELTTDEVLQSFCHEVAIMFSSDFVFELLSSEQGLGTRQLERIEFVFYVICECLNQQFYTRIGELAFFAVCRMTMELFLVDLSESQRNSIFTREISDSLCTYVAVALRNIQLQQLDALELGTFSLENIISHFADLILSDILPLTCAYELLHAHCCQTSKVEKHLRRFLLQLVARRFADDVAEWIFCYFAEYFKVGDEKLLVDLVEQAKRLSRLLQSIRNSVRNVTKKVHELGIDLSVSRLPSEGGLLAVRFLSILVEFSPCLGPDAKKQCFEYFRQKRIEGDLSVAKLYLHSLRVGKRRSIIDDTDSTESTVNEDVDEPEARVLRPSFDDSDLSDSTSS